MLHIDVPGWRSLHLEHLVLDVNGTLTRDGVLLPAVHERLDALKPMLHLVLLTADTLGRLDALAAELGVQGQRLERDQPEASQKERTIVGLGAAGVVAIGNGANDVDMLRSAALGIAVLGPEGLATSALFAAHLVVSSIDDGLDVLLNPKRLVASLRR